MFWLTFIPVYERLFPIFDTAQSDSLESQENTTIDTGKSDHLPDRESQWVSGYPDFRSNELHAKDYFRQSEEDLGNGNFRRQPGPESFYTVKKQGPERIELWESDFRKNDFRESDFRESDFQESDFRESDFRESGFRESDFRESDFRDSGTSGSFLSRVPRSADVPKFNVTFIYYGTYSATGVGIQVRTSFLNPFKL
jgi:uncharacterized protein YjbI with pentapeptide repeats